MHHGDGKAALAVPLANGDVGRRALVVALRGGAEFCMGSPEGRRPATQDNESHGHLESEAQVPTPA